MAVEYIKQQKPENINRLSRNKTRFSEIRIAVTFLPALLGIDRTGINIEMYKEESV